MKNETKTTILIVALLTSTVINVIQHFEIRQCWKNLRYKSDNTIPKEFGPDGYGFRHLRKEESELVRDCLMRMDDPWKRSTFLEDMTVTKTVTHEGL